MTKQFYYRNCTIQVRMAGRGLVEVECLSGRYEGITATTNDTEVFDLCEEDTSEGRNMRWSAYHLIRNEYYSRLNK